MAITAWAAKIVSRWISAIGERRRPARGAIAIAPIASSHLSSGHADIASGSRELWAAGARSHASAQASMRTSADDRASLDRPTAASAVQR